MPGPDAEPTDEELVTRIRSGEEGAADALFARYFRVLRERLRHRMLPRFRLKSAESDVIQEAYLAAYLRLPEFEDRGAGSFARWLGGIADNKLREEIRRRVGTAKRDVRREQGEGGAGTSITSGEGTPSSAAMAAEETVLLARAIDGMPEQYRTVLRLLYEQKLPLKAAGAQMNRSPDAVRMLYGRALAALAESMRRNGSAGPR